MKTKKGGTSNFRTALLRQCGSYAGVFIAMMAFAQQPLQAMTGPKIVLVGDSTVATEGGWGPGFCSHLKRGTECLDLAVNGRSTKSFLDEGLWEKALAERGKYYLIQFGHNDQKDLPSLHTDPQTTFKDNLHRYISDVRRIGGIPILVTPLSRRNYEGKTLILDPLQEYAAAARERAAQDDVPIIDLYRMSVAMLSAMSQEQADRYDAAAHQDAKAEGATAAKPDRTHLNDLGKSTFGDMVAQDVYRQIPDLEKYMIAPDSRHSTSLASMLTPIVRCANLRIES